MTKKVMKDELSLRLDKLRNYSGSSPAALLTIAKAIEVLLKIEAITNPQDNGPR